MNKERTESPIGKKFGRLKCIEFSHWNTLNCGRRDKQYLCICDCNQWCYAVKGALVRGYKKSCGCMHPENGASQRQRLENQQIDNLFVLERVFVEDNLHTMYKCRCNCGTILIMSRTDIIRGSKTGRCRSCPHPYEGQDFSKLHVNFLAVTAKTASNPYMKIFSCTCSCGRNCLVKYTSLFQGKSSCGYCTRRINGVLVSIPQEEIFKLLGVGELNYRIGPYKGDIVLKEEKIVIEYDEYFYHFDKLLHEGKRDKFMIDRGWKILHLRAADDIPTKEQIIEGMNNLITTTKQVEIIELDSWKKAILRGEKTHASVRG